jgi:subtilisin family serine protease
VLLCTRRAHSAAVAAIGVVVGVLTLVQLPTAYAEPPEPVKPSVPAPIPGRYIVTLTDKPIATYDGDVKGLRPTRPDKGQRVDVSSGAAKRYRAHLEDQQAKAAARVGAKPLKHYAVGLNGFATTLTPDQARTLQGAPGVLAVTEDTPRGLADNKLPVDFLKLSGSKGVWAGLGGTKQAGRGVVVGIVDSGYWPESKSFAGAALGTAPPTASDPYRPYRSGKKKIIMKKADGSRFVGTCEAGEDFTSAECNSKVIGARSFSKTYESQTPPAQRNDYLSPRDGDGHGTHVASTAAGNSGVTASIAGHSFGKISGVAPAAKLAIYKVAFTSATDSRPAIYIGDALAAIDAAIADGVDVINYSVSSSDAVDDPVDLAFLSAASAGIFVATAAGNSGPRPSTLHHVTPWVTTVAASTVAPYAGTVVLGDGKAYAGSSTTVIDDVAAKLVTGRSVKQASAAGDDAAVCAPDTLSSTKAAGKIVVCDRGVVAGVEKSAEVKRVRGKGMVLINLTDNSTESDTHAVPTVHLNVPFGAAVKASAEKAGATATLRRGNLSSTPMTYPQIPGFSSRGPSAGNGGDLLKPDIAAPGVSVLAAVSPPSNQNRKFDFYSGTSMASPHIAGVAALYFGVHPEWSPMAVKSAIMTTAARVKKADGNLSRDYLAQGAGNVRPDRMFNPGLIFNSRERDWLGFLEGVGFDTKSRVSPIDPSNYNSPSIAIGELVGSQTVTRKVTAVKPGVYQASVTVPGVAATVSPSVLDFGNAGQTKTIKITFSREAAPHSEPVFGSLKLEGAGTLARLPIVVVPVQAHPSSP